MAEGGRDTPTRSRFEGFGEKEIEEGGELNYRLSLRNLHRLEDMIEKLSERVAVLEEDRQGWKNEASQLGEKLKTVNEEKDKLREENEKLKRQMNAEMKEVKRNNEEVKKTVNLVQEKQDMWVKRNEGAEQSLKVIMEQQQKEKEDIKDKIVSVIKEKKKLVRDTVDKVKCVVIFGLKEEIIVNALERERKEKEKIGKIIATVTGEEGQSVRSVEEYHRIGKFEEQKDRPVKIKFATQVQAEEVLNGAWKLAAVEEFKKVWINKDLDEDERITLRELVKEAKQKNDLRTEEEKERFYWRVRDLRLKKKFIRG